MSLAIVVQGPRDVSPMLTVKALDPLENRDRLQVVKNGLVRLETSKKCPHETSNTSDCNVSLFESYNE